MSEKRTKDDHVESLIKQLKELPVSESLSLTTRPTPEFGWDPNKHYACEELRGKLPVGIRMSHEYRHECHSWCFVRVSEAPAEPPEPMCPTQRFKLEIVVDVEESGEGPWDKSDVMSYLAASVNNGDGIYVHEHAVRQLTVETVDPENDPGVPIVK
jgi:hypothetical protein